MKNILLIFITLLPLNLIAAENLVKLDYVGKWKSIFLTTTKAGEILYIRDDMSSTLEQTFKDGKKQILHTKENEFETIGDLLIFKYYYKEKLVNKTLLSGWKSGDRYQIYGTMFLYNEGKQFNGLPASFRKIKANK